MKKILIIALALSVMSCSSQSRFGKVRIPTSVSGQIIKFERKGSNTYTLTVDTKKYGRVEILGVPDDVYLTDIPVYADKGKLHYRKP